MFHGLGENNLSGDHTVKKLGLSPYTWVDEAD